MRSTKIDRFIRIAICALTVALVYAIYSGIHETRRDGRRFRALLHHHHR